MASRRCFLGDTLPFALVMETDESGLPWVAFTDYRLWFTVKRRASDPDALALVRLNSAPGGGISTGSSAYWTLDTELLRATGARTYFHDIQLERLSTGWVRTLEAGPLTIVQDITQSKSP